MWFENSINWNIGMSYLTNPYRYAVALTETCQTPNVQRSTGFGTAKPYLGIQFLTGHSAIGEDVVKVAFFLKRGASATGDVIAQYWTYASWNGNSPGTPTAESTTTYDIATDVGTEYAKFEFSFASAHTVSANDLFTLSRVGGEVSGDEVETYGDTNDCEPDCSTQYYTLYRVGTSAWSPYTGVSPGTGSNVKFCYFTAG